MTKDCSLPQGHNLRYCADEVVTALRRQAGAGADTAGAMRVPIVAANLGQKHVAETGIGGAELVQVVARGQDRDIATEDRRRDTTVKTWKDETQHIPIAAKGRVLRLGTSVPESLIYYPNLLNFSIPLQIGDVKN